MQTVETLTSVDHRKHVSRPLYFIPLANQKDLLLESFCFRPYRELRLLRGNMEMETVAGVGEETRPKANSGSAKEYDVVASGENGVRVSENGDESGVIEDCVMNGVSSLLKLKQDLKPFAESFEECSNASNARSIVTAVEEAVEEMGRHMERLLLKRSGGDCGAEAEDRVVKNAGIKEGVVVREVRREMISSLLVGKPEGILQDVRGFAATVSFGGLLELEVVKRKVSAFYRSKGGYGLTELQHRRKQKSIAEILENESCAMVRLEIESDDQKGKSSRKKVKRSDEGPKVDAASSGETSTQTGKRERKKSKYFSSEFLSDFSSKGRRKTKTEPESCIVPSQSQVGGGELMADGASNSLVVVEEDNPCELLLLENGEVHQELSNAVDFLRLGATAEEIRDLIRVSALGTEYPKDSSSRDMVREFMSIYRSFTYREGVNSKFLGSYNTADSDKEEVNGTGKPEKKIEQPGKEENETAKRRRKLKTQADEVEETRKEVTETTKKERKRRKPESEKKADEEEETLEEFTKKERIAKKPKSRKQGDEEEEEEASGSTKKEKKTKKPKFEEQETPSESEKKEREAKTKKQESEKEFSGAELFVTFGPGSSLPKKEVLIGIYGKFGALDEERSYVSETSFCARVAFLNVDEGETAFESSLENSPFGSISTVKFRLKYPNERAGKKKGEVEAEVAEAKTVEMGHLKKKFEEMISLVDKSERGMTAEVKVKLEEEMVNLLEEVRKMPLS
ncbi:Tudor/PWWP/MBT superfamily protein [Raphanus sativus]|nr:Tudor/PWWP/MBT superfamily protein [Raphanus sativus]